MGAWQRQGTLGGCDPGLLSGHVTIWRAMKKLLGLMDPYPDEPETVIPFSQLQAGLGVGGLRLELALSACPRLFHTSRGWA